MTMQRNYHRKYSREYYHKIRVELTKLLGGKCAECGSEEKLHFDHKDPKTRSFKIGKLLNHSKEEREEEIKKCQLLCQKCHMSKTAKEGSLIKNRQKGCEIWTAKLTDEKEKLIKLDIRDGIPHKTIAIKFGVSHGTIKNISCGKSWKHVNL